MRGAYLPYRQRLGQVRLLAKKAKDENKGKTHTGIVKTTIAAMSPHLVASGSSNHIMFLSYPPLLHILSILRRRIVEPVQRRSISRFSEGFASCFGGCVVVLTGMWEEGSQIMTEQLHAKI